MPAKCWPCSAKTVPASRPWSRFCSATTWPMPGPSRHSASACRPGDTRAALAAGIGMVHQHFTLAENLTVLENVMLGLEPLWRLRSRRQAVREQLLRAASAYGLQVDPAARVASLSVGERQRVEILKALVRGSRILILDEPTAVLTPQESESLFATLEKFTACRAGPHLHLPQAGRGAASQRSDRRAQARPDGAAGADRRRHQGVAGRGDGRQPGPARAVHGRAAGRRTCRPAADRTRARIDVEARGHAALRDVSLAVLAGEILAIAGVAGNGQQTPRPLAER